MMQASALICLNKYGVAELKAAKPATQLVSPERSYMPP